MTITPEDVADLRPGDVVELTAGPYTIRGPLEDYGSGELRVHIWTVRSAGGDAYLGNRLDRSLTVISRAPRPLYVNHDRTEPVPGDVARDAYSDANVRVWSYTEDGWQSCWMHHLYGPAKPQCDLRLLVDGETGQVVR